MIAHPALPKRFGVFYFIILLAGFIPGGPRVSPQPVLAQSNAGEVQIYVFSESGLPLKGAEAEADGVVYSTDENGYMQFRSAPGVRTFVILYQGKPIGRVEVPVRLGKATEVLLTASAAALVAATSEAKPADAVATDAVASGGTSDTETGSMTATVDPDSPKGTLRGKILHAESGEPVAGATVVFRGSAVEAVSGADGYFSVELPAGEWAFSVIHPQFSTRTVEGITVVASKLEETSVQLTPAAIQLDAVQVFASQEIRVQGGIATLLDESRNSGVVLNLIGNEQIARTGDSDAAAALSRVTGLTLVDGRFVYVRGMGERYSSSLLNGARLPSPEIDKRVVPLDLFPTSVVESLSIQKSFSPEMPGDFGGGVVSIRSAGIPNDRYARRLRTDIGFSVGYNDGTSLVEHLTEKSGPLDWLGIDTGTRGRPGGLPEQNVYDLTDDERESLGEELSKNWEPELRVLPLDYSGQVAIRDKIDFTGDRSLGLSASLLYRDSWDVSEQQQNSYVTDGERVDPANSYINFLTARDLDIGSLFTIGYWDGDRASVESTSLLVRATDSETSLLEGYYYDDDKDLRITEQSWIEQTLLNQAFSGSLAFGPDWASELRASYALSYAMRYEPDHRYVIYEEDGTIHPDADSIFDDASQILYSRSFAANRWFTTVSDFIHDGQVSASVPLSSLLLPEFFSVSDYLDIGINAMYQQRETDTRRFVYKADPSADSPVNLDPDALFTPDYIGFDGDEFIEFGESTLATDNYQGSHLILAGFVSSDVLVGEKLRFNAGVRTEYSKQTVDTVDLFTGYALPAAELETVDFLPGLNFTLAVGSKSQLRWGASRTVNRPDLQELSPAPKYGAPGEGVVRGNPDLERAILYNADLRWESYLTETENWSFGAFFKYFEDPIETIALAGADFPQTFANIPSAYNLGAELEWQLQLSGPANVLRSIGLGMADRGLRRTFAGMAAFVRDLRTTGNIALINSTIDYQGNDLGDNTNQVRPLQGQSPYVINVSLGYENSVSWSQRQPVKTGVFLNYNVFGPRIYKIGTNQIDDFYEQPFHQLDLVLKQRFSEDFSISFKAKNLLDLEARRTIGLDGPEEQSYRKGRSYSLSAKLEF